MPNKSERLDPAASGPPGYRLKPGFLPLSPLKALIQTLAGRRTQVIAHWKKLYIEALGSEAFFSADTVEPWLEAEFDAIVASFAGGSIPELGSLLQDTGRRYAEMGVPYGELVISMNLFEEACASAIRTASDAKEQLRAALLFDKLSHFRLIQLAEAYFERYVQLLKDSNHALLTSHARHESQMLRAEKLAGLGRLAAGVAHEINTPLATIALTVDEVLERTASPVSEATVTIAELKRIKSSVDRCKRITSGLLDLARVREAAIQSCKLKELLQMIVDTVSPQARAEGKTIRLTTAPDLEIVNTDPVQVEHIVLNLLTNALDAIPTGGKVTVESGRTDAGFFIEIADDGSGIPPEHLDRIFEPFFTTKPPGKGTGLGLATTNTMVQQLAGQLTVNSSVGQGTRMRLLLPNKGEQ